MHDFLSILGFGYLFLFPSAADVAKELLEEGGQMSFSKGFKFLVSVTVSGRNQGLLSGAKPFQWTLLLVTAGKKRREDTQISLSLSSLVFDRLLMSWADQQLA